MKGSVVVKYISELLISDQCRPYVLR